MAKAKTVFVCGNCGMEYPKWYGQCPSCRQWNTITEMKVAAAVPGQNAPAWSVGRSDVKRDARPLNIREVEYSARQRMSSADAEFDRVLGGGIVPGSLMLLGGEPGIGKSTLMLQIALRAAGLRTLYVSGEESAEQIKMRAERIGIVNEDCYILPETNLDAIFTQAAALEPQLVVIDSIQTLYTERAEASAGSITQIRECAAELIALRQGKRRPGGVDRPYHQGRCVGRAKDIGTHGGCCLAVEGDRNHMYRIVRAQKNRFGSTNEIGIYRMDARGLKVVENPSSALISGHNASLSGNSIAVTLEGIRPILIEVQALVSSAVYGTPQRTSTGYDTRRLNMLLAVLEKRAGFRLATRTFS